MKKNTNLKVLTGAIVFVVVLVLINSFRSPQTPTIETQEPNNLNEAIASQFNDDLREVAARLQETEKTLKHISDENERLARSVQIKPDEDNDTVHTDKILPLIEEINALKKELVTLREAQVSSDYEVKPEASEKPKAVEPVQENTPEPIWNPIKSNVAETKTHTPYYTMPAGSDLGQVTLLSALIGEVPADGKLMQPLFPFSAVINRGDLMAANGIPLPDELSGMKVSGYAIGVGSFLDNISCVRAYVTSALFVFEDGRFLTAGEEEMRHSSELLNNESLGYLTTPYGNPCIPGKFITNAPKVLGAFMAAGSVQGASNALADWQMSYLGDSSGIMKTPTGSLSHFVAGGAVNQGTAKVSEWIEKRIQGSFDIVYVPASIPNKTGSGFHPNTVTFHLTKTIPLDKENEGRLLHYGYQKAAALDSSLD